MPNLSRVETMNAGTPSAFERVFIECPSGHDLGNVPVSMFLPSDLIRDCRTCKKASA